MLSKNYVKIIDNIFTSGKLVHCYLLNYISKSNNDDALLYFLNKIDENNYKKVKKENLGSNIYLVDSQDSVIKKEEILDAFRDSNKTLLTENKSRIIIIKNVENASINGINAILKIIEDPIKNMVILLTTDSLPKVLSTVRSRSQIINIFSDSKDDVFQTLSADKKHNTLALVLSNIISDLTYAKKFYNIKFSELLYQLAEYVQKSWKNKHILYNFLTEQIVVEKFEKTFFLLNTLAYYYKLLISEDLNQLETRLKNKLLPANKIISPNISELSTFLFNVNDFLSNIEKRGLNFALQKEILLIKLMELYG